IVAPSVIGENPFNLERLAAKCLPTNANRSLPYLDIYHQLAFAGIEMAIWDIMGKACGVPCALLMGGIYRNEVAFSDYVFASKAMGETNESFMESVVKYCKKLVSQFHSPVLEFKVGVQPPEEDVEMVRRIREEVGEKIKLRVDANCAWTESTAMNTIRAIEKYELANIEEPSVTLEADAKIRRVVKTPISVHWPSPREVANYGLDAVVVNPLHFGGFYRTRKQFAIAEDLGLDIWLHSRCELGFGTAAYIHFLAAKRFSVLQSQSLIRPTKDFLTKEGKPTFENGVMHVPEGPGLGATLDTDKMEKYHQLFLELGEYQWLNSSGNSPPFY
ncbi:MAG: mandelate racemase/muconate lactonizing enzyme family protein, partial [Nitrososphaerales archaeon]